MEGDAEERQIQARFVTKLKTPYKVPATAITIPANLTRLGLSTIVNSLLNAAESSFPPLMTLKCFSLCSVVLLKFERNCDLLQEKIIEIEYIKAVVPRKQEEPSLHDDWVSADDGSCPRLRTHAALERKAMHRNLNFEYQAMIELFCNYSSEDSFTVATASKDQTLRLWKFDTEEPENSPANIRAFKILRGHNASVQSVAAETSGSMICSGSWDCTINLWKMDEYTEGDLVSIKKRKVKNKAKESQLEGKAMSTLVGHTQRVSSVVWPEHETIYSASWDHSIRRWDVETGKIQQKYSVEKLSTTFMLEVKVQLSLLLGPLTPSLGYGIHENQELLLLFISSSHTSWVSACKWHDKSWFHLLSASYDGKVMLWDLRTAWPLAVIESHEDKVLCVDWWRGDNLVSGGVDCKLCISSDSSVQNIFCLGLVNSSEMGKPDSASTAELKLIEEFKL
ncbi:hypothetical protein GH714_012639 [Hevea brasiliensis]|uniref:NLE domain-containing protein n=1 Tax=Hevea brasiliensis TaxID=3981 RepID=A0A6A6MK61_HEVBR|nr:hypothetical protein GH714_012639 [Hevea brasiliensis]